MDIIKNYKAFNFDNISLATPVRIQGGSYYSKIQINDEHPFFIQTPKCSTKNGIIESGKRTYTDLILNDEHNVFIQFILDIEKQVKKNLQIKNSSWFENSMDDEDIEYFFNTNLKSYRQHNYLFRTFIANSKTLTSMSNIQIYDDNEEEKSFDDVKDNTVISIIHLKGVKFTSSSFNIDIELKQVMILNDKPLFSKKLITKENLEKNTLLTSDDLEENKIEFVIENDEDGSDNDNDVDEQEEEKDKDKDNVVVDVDVDVSNNEQTNTGNGDNQDTNTEAVNNNTEAVNNNTEYVNNNEYDNKEKNKDILEEDDTNDLAKATGNNKPNRENELQEYTLNIDDSETIKLKNPNEVYYEIYKKAKLKAKEAKKQAIIAYLEAKSIKKTYMLEDLDDSSSDEEDFDNISEISYDDLE